MWKESRVRIKPISAKVSRAPKRPKVRPESPQKIGKTVIAVTAAILVASIIIGVLAAHFGGSKWWNKDWGYRKQITIQNTSASLENYQINLNVDYDGHMQTNFSDLRFVDGSTQLAYWIENYDAGKSAEVWVKIPSIPANDKKTIWMYYSNASATNVESGVTTFDFFDNCDTLNNWTLVSGNWSNDAGTIKGHGDGFLKLDLPPSIQNRKVGAKVKWNKGYNVNAGILGKYLDTSNYLRSVLSTESEGTGIKNQAYIAGSWKTAHLLSNDVTAGTWFDLQTDYYERNIVCHLDESTVSFSDSDWNQTWTGIVLLSYGMGPPFTDIWVDNFFVAKYVSPEPTTSIGSEEKL
jgi:hypothetical protein